MLASTDTRAFSGYTDGALHAPESLRDGRRLCHFLGEHQDPTTRRSAPVDDLTRLFSSYDRGTISRRQLFQALGLAAVAMPFARVLGQGQCAGRDRDTSSACNKTPFKAPFEPTGWKTVL